MITVTGAPFTTCAAILAILLMQSLYQEQQGRALCLAELDATPETT